MRSVRGFTLLEMMFAITLFGLLVGIGVPGFLNLVERNSVVTEANDMMASILLARSEAIKREVNTMLERTSATTWRAFIDNSPENGSFDTGEEILIAHTVSNNNISVTSNGEAVNGIRYGASGRVLGSGFTNEATDYFKLQRGNAPVRCIRFSLTGRPLVDKSVSEGGGCS